MLVDPATFTGSQSASHHHHGEIVEEIIDHDLEENIKNKLIFTFFTYDDLKEVTTIMDHHDLEENIYKIHKYFLYLLFLQGANDFKEFTTIMGNLLRTSLTTILKRIFERKENYYL